MSLIKATIKTEIIPLLFILIACVSSIYFYKHFPETVPSHWNINGEVDAYSSKTFGAFMLPAISIFMYVLFFFIPYLDPKKDRYAQFEKTYHVFKGILIVFMVTLYLFMGMNGLGYNYPVGTLIPVMIGILFIVLGNYMSKIKPNWFMGIRTPWTLSSEENWNKTHRLGAKIFVIGGILMMGMPLYSPLIKIIMTAVIIGGLTFGTIGYSLYLHLKDKKNGNNKQ
jgi:uncharacterized membrane protein